MHRTKSQLKSQAGLTLIETVVALAVAGLVVGAVWAVSARVKFNNDMNILEHGMTDTAAHIREFYKDRPFDAGLNNASALDANLVSPDLISNATLQHNLGSSGAGAVTISSPGNCGNLFNGFSIALTSLRADACNQLTAFLAGTSGAARSQNISAILVGGQDILGGTQSFNITKAKAQCTEGATAEVCFQQY